MLSQDDVREALRACFDASNPWKRPLNIVDLGLVESVSLALDEEAPGAGIPGVPPHQRLTLALVPPTADEDANTILLAQIQNRLAGLPELSHTTIHLAKTPAWTTSRISPELRRIVQPTFPILNNR